MKVRQKERKETLQVAEAAEGTQTKREVERRKKRN